MNENNAEESFTRFISPASLILVGLVILQFAPTIMGLTTQQVTTIGFGAFAVGAFSFVVIFNHARNPIATDKFAVNASQALVVYAGVLTILVYEGTFSTSALLVAVCVVLVLGTLASIVFERLGEDVNI
jgi:hypothetical protein